MRARQRNSWRLYRQWATAAGLALAVLGGCAVLKVRHDYATLPPLPQIADLPLSVVVLDRKDRLLRAFTSDDDKWRLPVGLGEIDPLYVKMLLAFEDKRFFSLTAGWICAP
ncbi:hypothetical protein QW131_04930 [Roseibium salinum]|nr:hypothetical protein [Roseibium salinum]